MDFAHTQRLSTISEYENETSKNNTVISNRNLCSSDSCTTRISDSYLNDSVSSLSSYSSYSNYSLTNVTNNLSLSNDSTSTTSSANKFRIALITLIGLASSLLGIGLIIYGNVCSSITGYILGSLFLALGLLIWAATCLYIYNRKNKISPLKEYVNLRILFPLKKKPTSFERNFFNKTQLY